MPGRTSTQPETIFDGPTVNIAGIEVLKPGVWNGVPLSLRDLQDIVDAFNETRDLLAPTVRLGHDARQAFARAMFGAGVAKSVAADENGWPNIGEPDRLYLSGETLMADVANVPEKLAAWAKSRRYNTRSVALKFNKVVNGKVYRWWLDHIALLGADTPAVDGLAPVSLSDSDQDRMIQFQYSATDTDGLLTFGDAAGAPGDAGTGSQSALETWIAQLTAAFDEGSPLVFSRRGAPTARNLFAVFVRHLRETARAELPLSERNPDVNVIETLRGMLGGLTLSAESPVADVVAKLNGLDATNVGKLVTLAVAAGISSADAFVGWLVGLLAGQGVQVPMGDLNALAAAVADKMGASAPPPDSGAAPPDAGATPPPMSSQDPAQPPAPTATGVVELSAIVVQQGAELASLKHELALRDARLQVAADAKARNIELPKPVFDHLVTLSAAGDKASYDAILGNTRSVPTSENGTAGKPDTAVELSDQGRKFAAMHGVKPEDVQATMVANSKNGS